ncbi:hypothetical protein V1279_003560 [Bradyrhizobium sp. AZCC 1610]
MVRSLPDRVSTPRGETAFAAAVLFKQTSTPSPFFANVTRRQLAFAAARIKDNEQLR